MAATHPYPLLLPLPVRRILCLILLLEVSCIISPCSGFAAPKINKVAGAGAGFGVPKNVQLHKTDDSPAVQKLVSVLEQQKAVLTGTEIGFDPDTGMRGMYTTKSFSKDKVICKIPSNLGIALSDPSVKVDNAPTIAQGGANFLKLYKNNEQAAKQWSFYLDSLPADEQIIANKTPDFFSDEELDLLEFPRIVAAAKRRQNEIKEVAEQTGIDKTELQLATALVSSRVFPIAVADIDADDNTAETEVGDDDGDTAIDDQGSVIQKVGERNFIRVLVPYIDMANHRSAQPNAKWTLIDPEKDDAWFALTATRNIKPGKEITISYGSQVDSTVELLLNYGFVPKEGNPIDKYMLKKGGDDTIVSADDWTTTLQEDKIMLSMTEEGDSDADTDVLKKIFQFRIQLKESYQPLLEKK